MRSLSKIFLIACGTFCAGLGFIGIFLPVLPTTPFLLLAAFCYARSSKRLYHWLLTNPWFGEYLKNYHEGRGMRVRHKALALILMWLSIGWTVQNAVPIWWGKLILLAIALGVSVHLLRVKTYRPMQQVGEAVE